MGIWEVRIDYLKSFRARKPKSIVFMVNEDDAKQGLLTLNFEWAIKTIAESIEKDNKKNKKGQKMQRESTFRLEPLPLTDDAKKHIEKIRRLAIDLFDAVCDIEYAAKTENNKVLGDIVRCVSITKTKIQEATFWANRGASYLGHEFKEI